MGEEDQGRSYCTHLHGWGRKKFRNHLVSGVNFSNEGKSSKGKLTPASAGFLFALGTANSY